MAYRSGSVTSGTGNATATTNKPVGLAAGDLILLAVALDRSQTATFTWPSGFTQQGTTGTNVGNFAHDERYAVATKIATSSEPSTYTVTASAGNDLILVAAAWTGRSGVSFVSVTTGPVASGSGSFSLPLTGGTAAAGDDIAWLGMVAANGAYTISAPSSYTSQTTAGPGPFFFDYVNLSTRDNVSAGATGTLTGSVTGSTGADGFGIVISLSLASVPVIGTLGQFDPEMRILGWF